MAAERRGNNLPDHLIVSIRKLRRLGRSMREIASAIGVSLWTVQKYCRLPEGLALENQQHGQTESEAGTNS
jgi:transposase